MAVFYRLIIGILALLPVVSFATFDPNVLYYYFNGNLGGHWNNGGSYFELSSSTHEGLCNQIYEANANPDTIRGEPWGEDHCRIIKTNGWEVAHTIRINQAFTCPLNATLSGGVCSCNEGYSEDNGQCVPDACPPNGTPAGQRSWWADEGSGPTLCVNYCEVIAVAQYERWYKDAATGDPRKAYLGPGFYTGDECYFEDEPWLILPDDDDDDEDDDCPPGYDSTRFNGKLVCVQSDDDDEPENCPPGFEQGTYNGRKVCIQPDKDQDKKCPVGYMRTTVNGVDVCVRSGETADQDNDKPTTKEETDKDGNTTTTTTTTNTICTGTGSCTTITTIETVERDPQGNITLEDIRQIVEQYSIAQFCRQKPDSVICSGGTQSSGTDQGMGAFLSQFCKENPQSTLCVGQSDFISEFCKQNPASPICGAQSGDGDGSFGGSCGSGFICEGDAIQCAIAKDQHMRSCQMFDNASYESDLYAAESGIEGDVTGDLEGSDTIDLTNMIDQSDALGGGSGVENLTITVAGRSIELEFSRINPYLAILGNILVAVSLLLAIRIIARG